MCEPAIKILPVVTTGLVKDTVAVGAYDVGQSFLRIKILGAAKEGHHIRFVRCEINVLHSALANHVVHELDGSSIGCF